MTKWLILIINQNGTQINADKTKIFSSIKRNSVYSYTHPDPPVGGPLLFLEGNNSINSLGVSLCALWLNNIL